MRHGQNFQIGTVDVAGHFDLCAEIVPLVQRKNDSNKISKNFDLVSKEAKAGIIHETGSFAQTLLHLLNNPEASSSGKNAHPIFHGPDIEKYDFLNRNISDLESVSDTSFFYEYEDTTGIARSFESPKELKFSITEVRSYSDDDTHKPICKMVTDQTTTFAVQQSAKISLALNRINRHHSHEAASVIENISKLKLT